MPESCRSVHRHRYRTDISILYCDSLCSVCLGEFLAFCSTLVANVGITSIILYHLTSMTITA